MQNERFEQEKSEFMHESADAGPSPSMPRRAFDWSVRVWRPVSTAVVALLTLTLGWHVFNGHHGISSWQQNRTQEKQLRKEIDQLEQENGRLRVRVDKLKSDPGAIEHEAREKLHYARPGEVIVALPPDPASQPQSAGK
jgi:cell division protein FtsB